MIRYTLTKIFYSLSRVPFWKPWGFWKWLVCTLFYLFLLIMFIIMLCLPMSEEIPDNENDNDEVAEQTEDGRDIHTGDVQITLRWETSDDLDLHVTDPLSFEICYNNKRSSSGGRLDVDANMSRDKLMRHPVENVYWPSGRAPKGEYKVNAVLYSHRTSGAVHYWVTVKNGDSTETYEGNLDDAIKNIEVVKFRHDESCFGTH